MSCVLLSTAAYNPIIEELVEYIESNEQFALDLNTTFVQESQASDTEAPFTYNDLYNYFQSVLTVSPSTENSMNIVRTFYRFAITEMGSKLLQNTFVNNWIKKWLNEWKGYLDSFASTSQLSTWLNSIEMR